MRFFLRLCLLVCLLQSSGCILAPTLDSISRAGFTSSDRERLLSREVGNFNEALFWGSPTEAAKFVEPEGLKKFFDQMRARSEGERIVESKIDVVEFSENSRAATVDVRVKFYEVAYQIVRTRLERQHWSFSMLDGWKLTSREIEPEKKS